jgi:hypothetical protein
MVRARLSKPRNCTGVAKISLAELMGGIFVGLPRIGSCIGVADAVVPWASCTRIESKKCTFHSKFSLRLPLYTNTTHLAPTREWKKVKCSRNKNEPAKKRINALVARNSSTLRGKKTAEGVRKGDW